MILKKCNFTSEPGTFSPEEGWWFMGYQCWLKVGVVLLLCCVQEDEPAEGTVSA